MPFVSQVSLRRGINGTSVPGAANASEPPPSSLLAARLAPNNGSTAQRIDRDNFSLLLDESLGLDEHGQPNLGTDLALNHRLIGIVVQAGLDKLGVQNDDPFVKASNARDQVIKCIKVIQLAVERTPEALMLPLKSEDATPQAENVPLFSWLLPKILSILALDIGNSELMTENIWQLLGKIVSAEHSRSDDLGHWVSISAYVQEMIGGLLWRLEQLEIVEPLLQIPLPTFSFHPPKRSASNSVEASQIGEDDGIFTCAGSLLRGLETISKMLRLVATSVFSRPSPTVHALKRGLTTMLDHQQRLWQLLMNTADASSTTNYRLSNLFKHFFDNLQYVLDHISEARWHSSLTYKLHTLWSESIADLALLSQTHNSEGIADQLVLALEKTVELSSRSSGLGGAVWRAMQSLPESIIDDEIVLPNLSPHIHNHLVKLSELATGDSRQELDAPSLCASNPPGMELDFVAEDNRPRKRLRLSSDEQGLDAMTLVQRLRQKLNLLFRARDDPELYGLEEIASNKFQTMLDSDQCRVFELLGQISCAYYISKSGNCNDGPLSQIRCPMCDSEADSMPARHDSIKEADRLIGIFTALVPLAQRSAKPRLVAMSSLRRLLAHTGSPNQLEISNSGVGQWCLQSLRSSARELRVSATSTLKCFVKASLPIEHGLVHKNRVYILDFLHSMWTRNLPFLQETTILALSEIASVSGEEELNIVLIRYVEFLGHPNPYISGLVYAELQKLARNMKTTPATLLKPFWRTIAVVVVRNFQTQPIIAQLLCEFVGTGMNVDVLLMFIEEFALPYLISTGRKDVVRRTALAHGQTVSTFDVCTKSNNFAAILSYLLTQYGQSGADGERVILSLLVDVSSEFGQHDLSEWIKLEPILIACELLKSIGDVGTATESKPYHGLRHLARLDSKRSAGSSGSKKSEAVANFLENHVLGIITQFAAIFNDSQSRQPNLEKRRCLAAIGELLKLGQDRISSALPQISACLRSAMENRDLCDKAFESWALMMRNLPHATVAPLIDQTLAIIVQHWGVFQDATQKSAYDLVENIWQDHKDSVAKALDLLPSLSEIPLLSGFEIEISESKKEMDHRQQMISFSQRLSSDNVTLVHQALKELVETLDEIQEWLHQSVLREHPETDIADLTRSILDACIRFNSNTDIATACGKTLGKIGCLDPNRIEAVKEKKSVLAISNFGRADETMDFIMFFLEEVLVKAFLSAPNTRSQGFLAWAMQELLKICGLEGTAGLRPRAPGNNTKYRGWWDLDESVRNALSPFLNSRYSLNVAMVQTRCVYPLFSSKAMSHKEWLQTLVLDLLTRAPGENIQLIFTICLRIVRYQDISIPVFLLPYAALNLFVAGAEPRGEDKQHLLNEMLAVLKQPLSGTHEYNENVKLCSQRIFDVLDYMSKWLQQRRKQFQAAVARNERGNVDHAVQLAESQISNVELVLDAIPPDLISSRAIECRSYSRALFHWEQHIRQASKTGADSDNLLARLQEIYTQIDEPDGIEGISAKMHALSIDQQVLEHQKAANWTAAQNWYEIQLQENPEDGTVQRNLLTCLRETGQNDALLNQFDKFEQIQSVARAVPFAVEAAWANGNWEKLNRIVSNTTVSDGDFNVVIGMILQALQKGDHQGASALFTDLRLSNAAGLTTNSTSSFQSCHDILFRLHALEDLEKICLATEQNGPKIRANLNHRIELVGADVSAKRYLLCLQRAAMALSPHFNKLDVACVWLATAKSARKSSLSGQAFNAILRATALGENSATIEHAKLMWRDGHHRKAIHKLEGAIQSGAFVSHDFEPKEMTMTSDQIKQQNVVVAKAQLMLAKWLDSAGQTQSDVIRKHYRTVTDSHRRWDKGWYYLGKHYNKILDSERTKPVGKEAQSYLTGEASKLVIENYLRALGFGSKYVFQTLPKVLTLWLELVSGMDQLQDARRGNEKFTAHLWKQRKQIVEETNAQVKKYVERLQPVMWYTILSQVVARIDISHQVVSDILVGIVVKVLRGFPRQAIWTVLALAKSSSKGRVNRGLTILSRVVEVSKKVGKDPSKKPSRDLSASEMRELITEGQQLSHELLRIADHELKDAKVTSVSLSRQFKFNHKIAPSQLVVPIEACLIPSMPNAQDPWPDRNFRAFPGEPVTIAAFLDDALVLSSLQKPRKLSIRGSNGKIYAVLAKPKDDLRKDQRLMEFNTMINRFLKRDVEASKRRLYIRTYAVVPLNEECGLIEWVNNLRTLRDILVRLYKERGISPNYPQIRALLDEGSTYSTNKTAEIFESKVLTLFPALFHDWFVEGFPDSSAWVAARLRYTRSCAVMSIVGHVLGLGDRHGENILFEEDNGGTLHVDFNCLFDKGLTFEKPELVPFRLTHNMVDALGVYGYDGPFRRCCEITLGLLRGNEDALMTILETFLYDPTTDFMGGKRKKTHPNVPDTPQGVLEGIRSKTRGILDGESIPLSVAGYVEEMIKRATDSNRLARMYIGWCAFF